MVLVLPSDCSDFFMDGTLKEAWEGYPAGTLVSDIDLTNVDASNVTNMYRMFRGATNFNQDISSWDVSNVTNMKWMFYEASSFNQPIGDWDTSSVTDMMGMFQDAISFNQPLFNWDTSNVVEIHQMFWGATNFNQDVTNWDTSSVSSSYGMNYMFYNSSLAQDLSRWSVPNISSEPTSFGNATGTNPVWGTTPYPHIKFQETTNDSDVVITIKEGGVEIGRSPITTNSRGFSQVFVPNDATTYEVSWDNKSKDFDVVSGTSSTDMLNTFKTVSLTPYYIRGVVKLDGVLVETALVRLVNDTTSSYVGDTFTNSSGEYELVVGNTTDDYHAFVEYTENVFVDSWSYTGHTGVVNGVVVDSNGDVVSVSDDGTVKKVSSLGSLDWSYTFSGSTIGVDGSGYFYVGASSDDRILKLSPSGVEEWDITFNTGAISIYDLVVRDLYIYYCVDYVVYKRNVGDGSLVWTSATQSNVVSSVGVDSAGVVYSGNFDGVVTKISSAGSDVWSTSFFTSIVNDLVVGPGDDFVYACAGGVLKKISSSDYEVWSVAVSTSDIDCLEVDSDGFIYVGVGDEVIKYNDSGFFVSKVVKGTGNNSVKVHSDFSVVSGNSDNNVYKFSQSFTKFNDFTYPFVKGGGL